MKNCREIEPLKTPYVDGEAAAADRATVDTHIDACGPCRNDVGVERAAREVVAARRAELRGSCPDALRASIASRLTQKPQAVERPSPARRWIPMSLAASILLVVGAIFGFGLTDKAHALAFQTTIDHVKCARFNSRATSVDHVAEGERWATVYGWPLKVPASRDEDLQLRAVRRCAVTDGRVAHLIYQWRGEPLSVYVLPTESLRGGAEVQRFGHDATMWAQNGRTYVLLTRAPRRAELDSVIGYVKANVY